MIQEIASIIIFGKGLAFWLGVLTLTLLLCTAMIPIFNHKKWTKIPMKFHFLLGKVTAGIAIIHGLLIASIYLGF